MTDAKDTKDAGEGITKSEMMDEVTLLISWLQQAASTGSEILDLLRLEMKLAITDVKRLIILAKLFIPMLVLTWVSFSAALSWQVYLLNESVSQGLIFLCFLQFCGLFSILMGFKYYRKSLRLPLTRQHIRQFIKGESSES